MAETAARGIIMLGANGSGKSALGRELARLLGFAHFDVENYWFYESDLPYTSVRPAEERNEMLLTDMKKYGSFVVSGDVSGWGGGFQDMFSVAIYVTAPKEIRMKRIEEREYARWGKRTLEGGDMYESRRDFIEFAASRDISEFERRISAYSCPVIRIESTQDCRLTAEHIVKRIVAENYF